MGWGERGGERGRERKGWLNREAFSPLLPLPRLQEIKVRARLLPVLTNQLGPEKQPPITCQDRAGPPSPLLLPLVPTPPAPMLGPGASPVGLQVFQSGFQIIEQVDFLAALRAVNIQQFAVVRVPHLPRRLPRAGSWEGKKSPSELLSSLVPCPVLLSLLLDSPRPVSLVCVCLGVRGWGVKYT